MRRATDPGFSLLEVMVSIAILGIALVTLIGITTNNMRTTLHAKQITAATFLARTRMADIEDQLLEEGFTDLNQDEDGDFSDQGRKEFRWTSLIEKVELPTDMVQKAQQATGDQMQEAQTAGSSNPMAAMSGLLGGFMGALIEPIRIGLENSVRRVTVTVFWNEVGKQEQSFEIVTYLTDPSKLDMAMGGVPGGANAAAPGGQPGTPGAAGARPGAGTPGAAGGGANPASTPRLKLGGKP